MLQQTVLKRWMWPQVLNHSDTDAEQRRLPVQQKPLSDPPDLASKTEIIKEYRTFFMKVAFCKASCGARDDIMGFRRFNMIQLNAGLNRQETTPDFFKPDPQLGPIYVKMSEPLKTSQPRNVTFLLKHTRQAHQVKRQCHWRRTSRLTTWLIEQKW